MASVERFHHGGLPDLDSRYTDFFGAKMALNHVDWEQFHSEDSREAFTAMEQAIRALPDNFLIDNRRAFHNLLIRMDAIRLTVHYLPGVPAAERLVRVKDVESWILMIAKEAVFRVQPIDRLEFPSGAMVVNAEGAHDGSHMKL
jgi:hypothetical protein